MISYKTLAVIGGIATVSGGGVLLTRSSIFKNKSVISKSTIRERLQKAGYSLNISNDNWNAILGEHNKTNHAVNIKFSSTNIDVQTLQTKCSEYLDGEDDDSKYEIAKRWCVEPRKISEFLVSINLSALKTDGADESNTDKSKWEKIVGTYGKNSRKKIPTFELQNPSGEDTWKELKNKCNTLLGLSPWNNDYEIAMESTKLWCVSSVVPE